METISFYKFVTYDDNWYACQKSNTPTGTSSTFMSWTSPSTTSTVPSQVHLLASPLSHKLSSTTTPSSMSYLRECLTLLRLGSLMFLWTIWLGPFLIRCVVCLSRVITFRESLHRRVVIEYCRLTQPLWAEVV